MLHLKEETWSHHFYLKQRKHCNHTSLLALKLKFSSSFFCSLLCQSALIEISFDPLCQRFLQKKCFSRMFWHKCFFAHLQKSTSAVVPFCVMFSFVTSSVQADFYLKPTKMFLGKLPVVWAQQMSVRAVRWQTDSFSWVQPCCCNRFKES